MKRIIALILLPVCFLTVASAQTIPDEAAIRERIVSVSARISSVKCDFVQTRQSSLLTDEAVSKGHMEYRRPGFLRWEYVSPMNMEFCADGRNLTLKVDGVPQPVGSHSRAVKEMAKMIIGSIEGNSLMDGSLFKSSIKKENGDIVVVLYPQNSSLKRMWKELAMTYNPQDFTVKSFVLKEISGDMTTIVFSGAKYEFSE